MNAREVLDYLRDIQEMMDKVSTFVEGMTFDEFAEDEKTHFAVLRAMEVIGEAAKHVPAECFSHRRPLAALVRLSRGAETQRYRDAAY